MINYKIIPFIIATFLCSMFLSILTNTFFIEINYIFSFQKSLQGLLAMIFLLALLLICSGMLFIFTLQRSDRWLYVVIGSLGFLTGYMITEISMGGLFNAILLSVIFAAALLNFDAELNEKYRNLIKPNFTSSITDASGSFIFFFSILIAINFYMFNNSLENKQQIIEKSMGLFIDPIIQVSEGAAINLISNFAPQVNVPIIDSQKEELIKQTNAEITFNLKNTFAKELQPYTALILNVISLAIFFTLFSVFKIIKPLMWPIGTLIFYLLKRFKYIKEDDHMVQTVRYTI